MKKTKMEKGITLIALIITIVVLLILAAVAINSITGDGILGKAQDAATKYNQAVKDEGDMLDYYELFLAGKAWTQNGTTVTRNGVTLEVGTTVTGYDAGVDGYTGGWAVLGVENGKLLLVSTTAVSSLTDYRAKPEEYYNNQGAKLHEICAIYGNGEYAEKARNLTVQDIARLAGKTATRKLGDKYVYTIDEGVVYHSRNGGTASETYWQMDDEGEFFDPFGKALSTEYPSFTVQMYSYEGIEDIDMNTISTKLYSIFESDELRRFHGFI